MQEPRTSIPKHHRFSGRRLAALLLLLVLAAAACDSSGPDEPPCETPADCTTLDGIEQALDGQLNPAGAVASDSVFYAVLTQLTTERLGEDVPGSPYTNEEVWVLARHADGRWSARNVSRSSTPSGGNIGGNPGPGSLALGPSGTVHALWGELDGFGDPDEYVDKVAYATKPPGGRWGQPELAYDAPPLSPDAFTGTRLPAFMAFDGDGTLHAAFTVDDGSFYGAAAVMSRRGGAWSAPEVVGAVGPGGSNTLWPHLASFTEAGRRVRFDIEFAGLSAGALGRGCRDGGDRGGGADHRAAVTLPENRRGVRGRVRRFGPSQSCFRLSAVCGPPSCERSERACTRGCRALSSVVHLQRPSLSQTPGDASPHRYAPACRQP